MNERELFMDALDLSSPVERSAFLDEKCANDLNLRQRIETLLASHEGVGSFLGIPVAERLANQASLPPGVDETQGMPADERITESLDFLTPSKQPGSLGHLGHYEILEVIGRGGFGIVVRAFDEKLHRVVAIKMMTPQLAATSPPRKRFLREARAAAAIRHDNVVSIFSVEEQPIPYLVMEYIDGPTLQQQLDAKGPLEVKEIVRFGQQVANGLAAAHAMRLIHRDIKPGNILLENGIEQRVKLTDFGLARAADDASMTQTGTIAGTPLYMAPEQACGAVLDHRADLFSLGSVLYVMCSGRPPFRAPNSIAVLKRVVDDMPRPIQEIIPETPTWLCDIISKLHAKKPEDRFASAQEVADLLGRCWAEMQQQGHVTSLPAVAVNNLASQEQCRGSGRSLQAVGGRRRTSVVAVLLLLFGGLGLSEATGMSRLTTTIIRIATGEGILVVESSDPSVKLLIDGEQVIISGAGVEEVRLRPGSYKLAALRDGKPVKLDQELVTISRDGRQVVRVLLEPKSGKTTPQSSIIAEPIVLLSKKGTAERRFDTLSEAVLAASGGETIEIRGNGPFVTGGMSVKRPLTICAGDGFRPVIEQSRESLASRLNLIWTEAPLVLEGITLARSGEGAGIQEKEIPYAPLLQAYDRGVIYAASCRILNSNGPCFHFWGNSKTRLPASNTLRILNSECLSYKAAELQVLSGVTYDVENSILSGWIALTLPQAAADPCLVRLHRNTLLSGGGLVTIDQLPTSNESSLVKPTMRIDFTSNVITSNAFGLMLLSSDQLTSATELESFGRRSIEWHEAQNVWNPTGLSLHSVTKDWKPISTTLKPGLEEWNLFWDQTNTGSIAGTPKFQGGDLLGRAKIAMKGLTPEDFRLLPESPGYRAGADDKDLGPDIDLVGPGEAYDRWKKTPEYQEWRTETDRLMEGDKEARASEMVQSAAPTFDAAQARQHQVTWARQLGVPLEMENSIGMKLRLIPPGSFLMGSPEHETGRGTDEAQHEVEITQPFFLGTHLVTVGQFKSFVSETGFKTEAEQGEGALIQLPGNQWHMDPKINWQSPGVEQTDDHPAVCLSWNDAKAFCEWLSAKEDKRYTLATEAQWEYACRAGASSKFFFGDSDQGLAEYAWISSNSAGQTHPIGQKKPNAWGLHDMLGNAYQWTADWYAADYNSHARPLADPSGPSLGRTRVMRGGAWCTNEKRTRNAFRNGGYAPSARATSFGFRVALVDTLNTAVSTPATGLISKLEGCGHPIMHLAFAPDGQSVLASSKHDICRWNAIDGSLQTKYSLGDNQLKCFVPLQDNQRLISADWYGNVCLWNLQAQKLIREFAGHRKTTRGLALSSDERLLLSGSDDGTVRLWDTASGEQLHVFSLGWCRSVAFGHDSSRAAFGKRTSVVVINVETRQQIHELEHPGGNPRALAFSPDDCHILAGCDDGSICLWEVASGELIHQTKLAKEIRTAGFLPDGRHFFVGCQDKTLRFFKTTSGKESLRIDETSHCTNFAAVSPVGNTIAVGGGDHLVDTVNYDYEADGDFAVRLWQLPESFQRVNDPISPSNPAAQQPVEAK